MNSKRLFLCTDLDRTIIPNGVQSESRSARSFFSSFVRMSRVRHAYVTGRHKELVIQAIKNYSLPMPDYAITDVGTKIYRVVDKHWQELDEWQQQIARDWNGVSHRQLQQLFKDISVLKLQEHSKQNIHKLSYYVSPHLDRQTLFEKMNKRLAEHGVAASLVWSIDEPKAIGLLDVLPRHATKLEAIEFLQQQLGFSADEVLFAGDSGNDLPVLISNVPSVLVANASEQLKINATTLAVQQGHMDSLYVARGQYLNMNGNYSAGVLEGVWHYQPDFREHLTKLTQL